MNDESEHKFHAGQYVIFRNAIWQVVRFFVDRTIRSQQRGRYEVRLIMQVPLTDPRDVYEYAIGETDVVSQYTCEGMMRGQNTESQFRAIGLLEVCQARQALDEFAARLAAPQ